ncbi:hypothetical protein [Limnochorda pilosa]|uniref:Uncharacterized protein n=1 Tax=Limnochorda pilosa TaxID=1555112 RepID=A0A0K2SKP5_LIMPI|nr:hypothetical protein [Limnochorda pilosa]BAS27597.1 hypothetical protein LIP_1751 [Limnochorda pilosa]
MLLWLAVLLGWLVLAAGGMGQAAGLRCRDADGRSTAARWARRWRRVAGWAAIGWGLALLWIFLDTLLAAVAR